MSDLYFEPYQIWVSEKSDKSNPSYLWRKQTIWLLEHLPELREGIWPSRPSNYTDPGGSRHASSKAKFTTAADVCCELELRLERCRVDGLLTEALYTWDYSETKLARYARTTESDIRRRTNAVIRIAITTSKP